MLTKLLVLFFLLSSLLKAEYEYSVENNNFTLSQGSAFPGVQKDYIYNYDRLRVDINYFEGDFFVKFIGDGVNYLGSEYVNSASFKYIQGSKSDTPFKTQSSFYNYEKGSIYAKLYRAYAGYEDNKNRVTLGLQNITMGVGRLWTPTNLFNPKHVYALKSDEIFGVAALSYTRHINDTTNLTVTSSIRKDNTLKYAARYKSFLEYADIAIDAVYSDTTKMIGYELEGNLADTGVEIRSEGAYISSKLQPNNEDIEFYQGILGADYGFLNGVNLVVEALYSSKEFSFLEIFSNINSDVQSNLTYSKFYAGTTLSYSLNIFLDASLLYIESFNEKNSRFVSPTITYTLNDYNTLILGAMMQFGEEGSEFGSFKNDVFYLNYKLSF